MKLVGRMAGALASTLAVCVAGVAFGQDQKEPAPKRDEVPKVEPSQNPNDKPADSASEPNDPSQESGLRDASLQPVLDGQQGRPANPPAVAPSRPAAQPIAPTSAKGAPVKAPAIPGFIPGVPREDGGLPARKFYPEGTFLSKRQGKLVKATTGDVVFVPARDAKGKGEAPMVLLPSQTLSRLEASPGVFATSTTVMLSGEVYVYFDRQYLLPTLYSVDRKSDGPEAKADDKNKPVTPATPAPTPTPTPTATTPSTPAAKPTEPKASETTDPAVADLIRELETKRGSAKASDASASTPATTGGAERTTTTPTAKPELKAVTAEGTVLFNTRARLVRVAAGPLMVAFDGDTKSPGPTPMVLLRCRMAQKLDELAASRGDDLVMQISGRVFVYGGRNYLLPTLAQVLPTGDVKTLQ